MSETLKIYRDSRIKEIENFNGVFELMSDSNIVVTLKAGDTSPSLKVQLIDRPSMCAVDLTGASAQFKMYQVNEDATVTELVDAPAVITDAENGLLEYDWQTGDTDVSGNHSAEFIITNAGEIETFPNEGYLEICIESLS